MIRIKRWKMTAGRLLIATLGFTLTATSAVTLADNALSIGISVSDLGNPYFTQIARGAEIQAKQLVGDNANVVVVSSAYDVKRQIEQIEGFVAQGMDMILLSAASYDGVEAAVLKARKAGVKVLAVDVKAKGADATVTTDNTQAGMIACDYLVKQLGGQGRVVIINGPKVSSVRERVAGCKEVLAQSPGIQLLSSDLNSGGGREGGLESMTYLLTQFQQIDGVFTINDPSALGAQDAAQFAGRDDFMIVSVDGAPGVEQQLRAENSLIKATAAQFPNYMAAKAVEAGYRLMQGETLEQTTILIPAELITRETVDSYQGW
ncbi:ABC transporter substrate-binding protein [uncultured Amphritea sp.]|uniref:ABC transporter substrate-binding protein n=1 Tax=uncultured Amphritea sp. TaxID=981605 RepID=UPI00262388E6|nr:ABC transporter substrate-binding protein [uncultured Amphritea sp.]